jgi:16S rRNA (guanine1516-N2)-methyltransferase
MARQDGGSLARALGVSARAPLPVVDATAGLGRDGFLLAALGCAVVMIERAPGIAAALREALATAEGAHAEAAARVTVLEGDARTVLPTLAPERVLVDPMHPPRGNTALVKLRMRRLRAVVGDDGDRDELIAAALASATRRVVLKWPRPARLPDFLPVPTFEIAGRTTTFHVFVAR